MPFLLNAEDMLKPSDPEANRGLFQLDPEFGQMAVNMGSATWGIEALSRREKALLCLTADICDRNTGLAFEMHIAMALANDVPLADIREVILHAAPEAGYSNALQALIRFKQIAKEKGYGEVEVENEEPNETVQDSTVKDRLDSLASGFAQTWCVAVGQQWQRPQLNIRERCLLSICSHVIEQTLGEPFAYRVRLAISRGISHEEIQAAIHFLSEFGASKAWEALVRLQTVTAHLKAT